MLAQRSCIVDAGTAKGRIGLAELKPPSWPLRQGEAKKPNQNYGPLSEARKINKLAKNMRYRLF
jgi:hypothetical protein